MLQTRKNILNALRASDQLPAHFRMILAGGDGHGSEAIHEFIRKEQLGLRVTLLGHVAKERLPILCQAGDVLLFTSFEEGFGLPVLEATTCGLPGVGRILAAGSGGRRRSVHSPTRSSRHSGKGRARRRGHQLERTTYRARVQPGARGPLASCRGTDLLAL